MERSSALLEAYAEPVRVQLTSDNETEVLLSTIGRLGRFDRREVVLRPANTCSWARGAAAGTWRQTVIVAPGMDAVDIRCVENCLGERTGAA